MPVTRAVLVSVLAASAAIASADPCPGGWMPAGFHPWPINTPVLYDFEPGVTTDLVWGFERAVEDWNYANALGGTGIRLERAGMRAPNLYVANGDLPGGLGDPNGAVLGLFEPLEFYSMSNRMATGRLTIDVLAHDASRDSFRTALRKTAVHELGHSFGLDHPFPESDEIKGGSVMNAVSTAVNQEDDWQALKPTPCDIARMGVYVGVINGPTPPPTPRRPMPPQMPDYVCRACTVYVRGSEPGAPRIPIDTYCCGGNAGNEGPRSPSPPPSMTHMSRTLIDTGYHCAKDGWLQLREGCHADLCCAHPDDIPPHIIGSPAGTTCSQQGWWEHNQADRCFASWNESCIKKEVCGAGPCTPWPHYCWKEPHDAPEPQPTPDPNVGVTCASKQWFDGNAYDACVAAHGSCERKQDCDGMQCLPAPFYCWKPS